MQRIAVVIVTFNNAAMLRNLLLDCAEQSRPPDDIVVVDNASTDTTPRMMTEDFARLHYIRLAENTGSAGGYCAGIREVMATADGIWTLDDDVRQRLQPDTLENLVRGYTELEKIHRIGAVRTVGPGHPANAGGELEIAPWRGTLWAGEVVRRMGPPRSDYFIYGEDIEYSLRMRKLGYFCYWVPTSLSTEVRKEKTGRRIFGKQVRIYPTPFRLYYAFRNEISIYSEYRRIDKLVRVGLYALKVIGYLTVAERSCATPKIKAVLTGLLHGFIGRLGKNPRFLP